MLRTTFAIRLALILAVFSILTYGRLQSWQVFASLLRGRGVSDEEADRQYRICTYGAARKLDRRRNA